LKVTFPHMGTIDLLLSDLFTRLEIDFLVPPKTSAKTISLGARYAPEFACFPLKVTIGNLIEGLDLGVDTVAMVGGLGPCRFGFYAEVQNRVLRDIGYDFEMIVLEPPAIGMKIFLERCRRLAPKKPLWQIFQAVRIGWKKATAVDEVEKRVLQTRAFERKKGDTTRAHREALKVLSEAVTAEEIRSAREEALAIIDFVERREQNPLRVGIVGEFYILLEPFVNFGIEEYLGNKGIYLERSVYLTDWLNPTGKKPVFGVIKEEIHQAAEPYLAHFVGGEGQDTIGHIVRWAREGFDGIIHFLPFTCMPEIIARSIFPKIGRELDIPILSLVIDEQTGKAGVITRLEAFIDLMGNRRKKRLVAS